MQSHEKKTPLSQLALKLDFFQEDIWLGHRLLFFFFKSEPKKELKNF